MRVSFLEIYNEELTDLLGAESVENPRLKIYEDNLRKVPVFHCSTLYIVFKSIFSFNNKN